MSWQRFGYICRKAAASCSDSETISSCLTRVSNESSCQLYGAQLQSGSLPSYLLAVISASTDKKSSTQALRLYGELQLAQNLEEPMRFKRIVAYLACVIFVFYIVVSIYQLKVAPTFLKAFENFDIAIPKYLSWYQDFWGLFVVVVSTLLISSLIIGRYLKNMFRFKPGIEDSLVLKYMTLRGIRGSYLKVLDILRFPILEITIPKDKPRSKIIEHLKEIERSEMSVSVEMNTLLHREMSVLIDNCERQMKYISILVAVITVSAIFLFLASAYSPIFIMGETI